MMIFRRLYSRRSKLARNIRRPNADPGIFQQRKMLQEPLEEIENMDFEELESDFMNVHVSHKMHLAEMEGRKEKEKYLIVKQKYFKEKYPNFLTWHDKKQIRYLHNKDPEEWTIEKLSEGFPAFPDVIEKIVKGKWTKRNQNKVVSHDKTVVQNWRNFKQGKLDSLPAELKEHLQKFTNRSLRFGSFEESEDNYLTVVDQNRKKGPRGEFAEIITSYQQCKTAQNNNQEKVTSEKLQREVYTDCVFNNDRSKLKNNRKLLTFKELQDTVKQESSRGQKITLREQLLKGVSIQKGDNAAPVELSQEDISSIVEHRHETESNKVGFVQKTSKDMSHLIYPQKIAIPEKIYEKGRTYKLNDCYYDSDGEFLYRVPGMD